MAWAQEQVQLRTRAYPDCRVRQDKERVRAQQAEGTCRRHSMEVAFLGQGTGMSPVESKSKGVKFLKGEEEGCLGCSDG